jgi:hypothetical protein
VTVFSHSLANEGWWGEKKTGSPEMPVHVAVEYLDDKGQKQTWDHGFLLHAAASENLQQNPATKMWEIKKGESSLLNVTPLVKGEPGRFCFALLEDEVRRDLRGETVLPRPRTLTRLKLFGNGWDFKAAVANVKLFVR